MRLAEPEWTNPLDPSFAAVSGGRWNPPGSFPVLYMNADVQIARLQIERLLAGSPVPPDDLDDGAYVLVAATLPRAQRCADAVTGAGLRALGLPATYPIDDSGAQISREPCPTIGAGLANDRLCGVWCRSACMPDGRGRELAWFPATPRSLARPVWDAPLPLGRWRDADRWEDLGLDKQKEPEP